MDQVKIGRFIAEQRKARQLTQRQLAGELDISDKTISKWETGQGKPDLDNLLRLSQLYHVSTDYILTGVQPDSPAPPPPRPMQPEARRALAHIAVIGATAAITVLFILALTWIAKYLL